MTPNLDRNVAKVLTGAFNEHYELPARVVEMAAAVSKLERAGREARIRMNDRSRWPDSVDHALADEAIDVALNEGDLSELVTRSLKARADNDAAVIESRLLGQARERAVSDLRELLVGQSEQIIVECLRPVLDEIVKKTRACAADLEGIEFDADVILTAGNEKQRKAFRTMKELGARYSAIRAAWEGLGNLMPGQTVDANGTWSEFSNPTAFRTPRSGPAHDPFPSDAAERLLFAVANDLRPWLPLRSEQDEAARAWSADQSETESRSRREASRGETVVFG